MLDEYPRDSFGVPLRKQVARGYESLKLYWDRSRLLIALPFFAHRRRDCVSQTEVNS